MNSVSQKNRVGILRNPRSGTGRRRHLVLDLVKRLRERGFRPRVFKDREKMACWVADEARRADLACVVAVGGDGTAADVYNRYPGVPFALLPAGTENLLAAQLGFPACGRTVAEMIANGATRKLDLLEVGNRRCALMASVGFDADVIHRLFEMRTGNITRLNYIPLVLASLRKYRYPPLRVWRDDEETPLVTSLAMAFNLPRYGAGLTPARAALADDGRLDVRLFERGSGFQIVRYFIKVALGIHERSPDVISSQATRLRIESDVPVPVQADGDPAGWTPVEIRVLPAALEVFVSK